MRNSPNDVVSSKDDTKKDEIEEAEENWSETVDTFDDFDLKIDLLRGI